MNNERLNYNSLKKDMSLYYKYRSNEQRTKIINYLNNYKIDDVFLKISQEEKLINNRSQINYAIANIYCDESEYLLHSNDPIVHDNQTKKGLEIIEIAVEYCEQANTQATLSKTKILVELALRRIYSIRFFLYYLSGDTFHFEKYASQAIEMNSINAMQLLVKIYCDKDDLDKALYYYYMCMDIDPINYCMGVDNNQSNQKSIEVVFASKLLSGTNLYLYLFENGIYDKALKVAKETELLLKSISMPGQKEFEEIVKKRILDCEKKLKEISDHKKNVPSLSEYFSDDIVKMMDHDIRIYINTSITIYDYIKNSDIEMDYSSSLIPAMKAVESLLYTIISKYLNYINGRKNIDINILPNSFIYENKKTNSMNIKKSISRIEYGEAVRAIGISNNNELFSDNKKWKINDYFRNFCIANNMKEELVDKTLLSFVGKLDSLRGKRNLVAHRDRVYMSVADDCIKNLIMEHINFISFLYESFDFCFTK